MAAAQERWEEAVAHWQCAGGHARQVQDRAQLATRLVALMEALSHLGRHQEAQAAWQEARAIAEEEGYWLLLGRGEEVLGELAVEEERVEEAFQHAVNRCAWMAQHNVLDDHKAQRRLFGRLLALPLEQVSPTAQLVREDWRQRGLADPYPVLDRVCQELIPLLVELARWQEHGQGQPGGP
ncbi:hypothetical protein [Thermogemmatispora tikiterensis]|uniref:MalT-like TPR region domain-containing protein n=1 Tax=Thermogemmatispora tikiterensis TaxID=1825093 RepID=A0A328VDP6_9CHLR|nr:hypothetical protein [Thermogemmatispora tikiterensis]RAQ95868.1 hypothetical protein A4R35_09995 [Thermogemmatispora tikiterensis]